MCAETLRRQATETEVSRTWELPDWEGFRPFVEDTLGSYFQDATRRARLTSPSFGQLWERLEESLDGGKWLRPQLVHMAYRAFGGTDVPACAKVAACFEILHAALVIHDDVIDRDFTRRGRPTLSARYRDQAEALGQDADEAHHSGQSAAIIAGDLLIAGSFRLADSASADHDTRAQLVEVVQDALFASAAGELEDLLLSFEPAVPDLTRVLDMEHLKTAVYSFAAPLRAGAILAGVPDADARKLEGIGRSIGVAYQIVDDVLGTFGDSEHTGKSTSSDLLESKRTILTTFAGREASFEEAFTSARTADDNLLEQLRTELRDSGAQEYAISLASDLVTDALAQAEQLRLPPELRSELTRMCHLVLTRKR